MEQIMRMFDDTKAWNLPVVNEEGKYIGFVSKSVTFDISLFIFGEAFLSYIGLGI